MTLAQKLFGLHGRLRRRDYWLFVVLISVTTSILQALTRVILDVGPLDPRVMLAGTITWWPHYAVAIKRMHDRNYSGWLVFAGWLPGYLVMAALLVGASTGVIWGLGFIAAIPALWLLVELGFLDGTQGDNRYGPSPKRY